MTSLAPKKEQAQLYIHQSAYAKALRNRLPKEAFEPCADKLAVLLINLSILILGWAIARQIHVWSFWLGLIYPFFALVMGNCVVVLAFSSHELLHGSVIRRPRLAYWIGLAGFAIPWMPPTLWKNLHNRFHHNNTNALADPDRNYLATQPKTWGKWVQNAFVPSAQVSPIGLVIGMPFSWGFHAFRHLVSVLFYNRSSVDFVPAAFSVKPAERKKIFGETLILVSVHLGAIAFLEFNPWKVLLAYFIPIGIGYAGLIFYIFTNHLACPMTAVNDPLCNSFSIKVPKIFDLLHMNFSYHAEHHIFPSLNSDYYPQVRELLREEYPDRMGYIVPAQKAWKILLSTPRFYQDETHFTDWNGQEVVPVQPLNLSTLEES